MTSRTLTRRHNAVLTVLLAIVIVFAGRLVYVQALEGPRLAEDALNTRLRHSTLQGPRGDILDANGEVLATSVQRYNVGVNQIRVRDFEAEIDGEDKEGAVAAAALLAPILGRDAAELGADMVGESTFAYIARGLTPAQWREISALRIPGIEPELTSERIYPNGTTAGNVLGYVGRDGEGLAGLELTFEDALRGVPGSSVVEVGRTGQSIPTGLRETTPAQPGDTLHTSIDRDIQFRAQEVIDATVDRYAAQWGALVVQEIETGRILALADSDTVDPNDYQATPPENRGSRAVQAAYENGSTGKLPTLAAALDAGVVTPTTTFTTPDRYTTPSGQTFSDADPHATEQMTVAGILATSSNTGTVMIGDRLSDEQRYEYMRAFGMGERTGIELPGETPGILGSPDTWDGRQRYTTMFGQGLAVNLVQNTAIVAALGNGGVYLPPRLVDGTTDASGRFHAAEAAEGRQVVSEETAAQMVTMMEGVVSQEGTGVLGQLDGYRLAGKTGTAQVPDDEGNLTRTVANFVGVAPADDPQFAVGIVVYHPGHQVPSSIIAAPAFKEIAGFTLQHLGIPPSTTPASLFPLRAQ
ncbi:penicillin-binding protein 2 [Georgenia sp. 311]|uniref:peptidoglycan D,D-transpeptidase FtsI family protein n=1 Tax=Georgenia sp. 311 TaxID=2585134 RepID=UPI00111249AF|nr:penicillin-binding protein 2 [Georgenia sp. 311]TNC16684.1 penicillin-binding protein 2 [Georgenia sp. 311]